MLYPRRLEGESCAGLIPSPPGLGWDGDWENNKTKTPIIVPPGEQSAVNMLNSTPQEAISVPNLHTCPQSGHVQHGTKDPETAAWGSLNSALYGPHTI